MLLEHTLLLLTQGQRRQLPETATGWAQAMRSREQARLHSPQEPSKVLSKTPPVHQTPEGSALSKGKSNHCLYLSKSNSVPRRFKEFDFDAK